MGFVSFFGAKACQAVLCLHEGRLTRGSMDAAAMQRKVSLCSAAAGMDTGSRP